MTLATFAAAREKRKTFSGRIVAYDVMSSLTCLNGGAFYSMIVRVEKPAGGYTPFIEVHFSLPCDEPPKLLNTQSSVRKLRLIRDKQYDQVLEEFTASLDETAKNAASPPPPMRRWKFVPGAEDIKLPFGQTLPGFRSADLPTAPVL